MTGHVMFGGVLSSTLTGNVQFVVRLARLVAVQVIVVVVRTVKRELALLHTRLRIPEPKVVFTVGKKFTIGLGMPSEGCSV